MFEKLRKYYDRLVVDYIFYKGKLVNSYHGFLKNVSVWLWLAKTKLQSYRVKINHGLEAVKVKIIKTIEVIKKTTNKIIDTTIRFIDSLKATIDMLRANYRINKIPKLEAKVIRLKEKVGFISDSFDATEV